jgi:hypothetical protein
MRALAGIKNLFPGMLPKGYDHWQKCVTAQGNYFEGNVV